MDGAGPESTGTYVPTLTRLTRLRENSPTATNSRLPRDRVWHGWERESV